MGQFLAPILYFCLENGLPPLTVLVVNEESGQPGDGFGIQDPNLAREQVFDYPWHDYAPPTEHELKESYERGKSSYPQHSGQRLR